LIALIINARPRDRVSGIGYQEIAF